MIKADRLHVWTVPASRTPDTPGHICGDSFPDSSGTVALSSAGTFFRDSAVFASIHSLHISKIGYFSGFPPTDCTGRSLTK